jgi:thymidylate synthase (FAD)
MEAKYIDHLGDDLRVVNAARVSFDKESSWEREEPYAADMDLFPLKDKILSEKDTKLISYLAKHGHWTPFAHPQITIRETVPIFVARQRFKHTVGFAYNEVSRRYVSDEPEFFVPDSWRKAPTNGAKQGSSDDFGENDQTHFTNLLKTIHDQSVENYNALIVQGMAPEQARMILPQSMYTSYYVTGSLAAWARSYKARIDAHSQKEIQDLAKQWGNVIEPLFPVSWAALTQ